MSARACGPEGQAWLAASPPALGRPSPEIPTHDVRIDFPFLLPYQLGHVACLSDVILRGLMQISI